MTDQAVSTPLAISIRGISKTYKGGFQALKAVDLDIKRGEMFARLGPNGEGKTRLISIVYGIVRPSSSTVTADGHNVLSDYRAARRLIGLVPRELSNDAFEMVRVLVSFSRGLFALYRFEMARTLRTLMQSIASPVLSTALYFIVLGTAIGSRTGHIGGTSYGAFIIPGLIMLSLLNESIPKRR